AAAQFAARTMIDKWTEPQCLSGWRGRRLRALEDIGDAQRQFTCLERLCDVVVSTELEPRNAALGGIARTKNQDRYGRGGANQLDEIKAAFARHHDVEDQEIKIEARKPCPCVSGGLRRGHPVTFTLEKARQQAADASIVIDDQKMRRVVGRRGKRSGHRMIPGISILTGTSPAAGRPSCG